MKKSGLWLLVCGLILFPCIALGASFTEVGGGSQRIPAIANGSTVSTQDFIFPNNVTAGQFCWVAGNIYIEAVTPVGITASDTRGTSYTVSTSSPTGSVTDFIAYPTAGGVASSGANTITVSFASGGFASGTGDCFTAADATPFDVYDQASASNSSPSTIIATGVENALIVGVLTPSGTGITMTPTGGNTEVGENEDNSCCQAFSVVFQLGGVAGNYNVNWTLDSIRDWYVSAWSFEPGAAAAVTAKLRAVIEQ